MPGHPVERAERGAARAYLGAYPQPRTRLGRAGHPSNRYQRGAIDFSLPLFQPKYINSQQRSIAFNNEATWKCTCMYIEGIEAKGGPD